MSKKVKTNRKKPKMPRWKKIVCALCSIIIVGCIVTSGVLFCFSYPCEVCGKYFCFSDHSVDLNGFGTSTRPKKKTNQTTTQLVKTQMQPESYFNNIYFVGDSRCVALEKFGIQKSHIFASVGLNHVSAMEDEVVQLAPNKRVSIPDAIKITAPKIAIVNFGINGARFMNKQEFMSTYEEFMDLLVKNSPNTIFIMEAILPVGIDFETTKFTNSTIDELNVEILAMAKEKGFYYLGTDEIMKNSYNDLKKEYNSGDGLHFSAEGYQAVLDYVRSHALIIEE